MGERILTQQALNRALLARQGLLDRLPASVSLPQALERVGCLQAQYAPSLYVGLWSRLEGFRWAALDRALARRTVVQATLMRGTIHLASAADYWPLARAAAGQTREAWLRYRPPVTPADMEAAAAVLRERLRDGPMWRAEVAEAIGKDQTGGINFWLDLVRVPPSGTWARRKADLWGLAEDWLGPSDVTADQGLEAAVRRYLRGCGPASRESIANWMGVTPPTVDPVLERLDLRRFAAEDGAVLVDLPRAPLPDPATPAPVRLIGHWDQILLVHCRRTGVLDEELRKRLFHVRNPHSNAVFLVDGTVAGVWKLDGRRFGYEPWVDLRAPDRRAVEAEGERLVAALPD